MIPDRRSPVRSCGSSGPAAASASSATTAMSPTSSTMPSWSWHCSRRLVTPQKERSMSDAATKTLKARCACGCVEYEAIGAPITSVICYCASCQKAGRDFEQLPDAPPVLDSDGGTAFVLYRRDRVRRRQGQGHLKA